MERQTQKAFDGCFFGLLGLLIGLIIKLISLIIGGIIGIFIKGGERNPEKDLGQLKQTVSYPHQIRGVVCNGCETENEEHKTHCYMCGLALVEQREVERSSKVITGTQLALGAVAIVFLLIVYGAIKNNTYPRTSNVQASNQSNSVVMSTPTAVSSTQEMAAVISGYLNAVSGAGCSLAGNYVLANGRLFTERCESGYFKVYNVSEVSHVKELGNETTLFLAKGRFKVGEEIYEKLNFEIFHGKIREFPRPIEDSKEASPQPILTPTEITESSSSDIFQLKSQFFLPLIAK